MDEKRYRYAQIGIETFRIPNISDAEMDARGFTAAEFTYRQSAPVAYGPDWERSGFWHWFKMKVSKTYRENYRAQQKRLIELIESRIRAFEGDR